MDENKKIIVTLTDGTKIEGTGDGAGNIRCAKKLDKAKFSNENLKEVTLEEGGYISHLQNMTLRTFYYEDKGTFLRLGEMSEVELLQEENRALRDANDMLTECILEMSEMVYGE